MIKKGITINKAKLLMMGITFKENCPDVRNTKIVDVVHALEDYGIEVTIFDPWAKPEEVKHEYGLKTVNDLPNSAFDAIVLGVAHQEFTKIDLTSLKTANSVIFDVKGVLRETADARL